MALRAVANKRGGEPTKALWAAPGTVALRLAYRSPLQAQQLFGFLASRAVPGVEEGDLTRYRRTLSLPCGTGIAEISAEGTAEGYLRCSLALEDLRDLRPRCAAWELFDLNANRAAVVEALRDDGVLGESVTGLPGLRTPGHVDGDELAFRAVLGQQVSVAGARRSQLASWRSTARLGEASGSSL